MPSPLENVLCRYHYDPLDRLTSHALPDVSQCQRFYCKSRLTTEIQGAVHYSIIQHDDQLLAQQRSGGVASDTTLLATDQQRSVIQMLKADNPRQPIAFSPYGHRPVESGLLSLLGFNGERPDPVTGCYLLGNGYRAFNPVLMRFNSPDSRSPFGKGGLNAYAYCAGDPINRADPTGHTYIKSLLITMSHNTTPVPKHTIDALQLTQRNIGTNTELATVAAQKGISPEKHLVLETINRKIGNITNDFNYFENPRFKITDTNTINRIYSETKNNVETHSGVLRELRNKNEFLLDENTLTEINFTLKRSHRFLHQRALDITNKRIERLHRDNALNYTLDAPPHYDEQLFTGRLQSLNVYSNQIRTG